ncbi:XK-related protein 8.3 [Brienomyrus brachyistius]|uniref:XK-related protein 8.3 n=1 Tax=Brienomyrus brachyistius TaxID=42636 RepID=UPI0020B2E161|nr:XK-related protein 8.3 [Brienomyrus brachyistius]
MTVNILKGTMGRLKCNYSLLDLIFSVTGFCTFLIDVGTDFWVASEFFSHGDFIWFGVWIFFMISSSIVVQAFSWLWYKYDRKVDGFETKTAEENVLFGTERFLRLSSVLHIFQLGFLFRYISTVWQGVRLRCNGELSSDFVLYMDHDISMLRLIKTFCESTPQLTLMIYILLHNSHVGTFQYISPAVSMISIAWMVVSYHRAMRSFLPDKANQGWGSSVLYFLWNLLLIGQRICSVALFASVLPYCLLYHFLLLWPSLILWAHLQKTAFMDSTFGEWLYRTIVGLVWYFSWFNVVEGNTKGRAVIYHAFMVTDGAILLTTWWCYRDSEKTQHYAIWLVSILVLVHILGILVKILYYRCFHPTLSLPPAGTDREDMLDGKTLWQNQRMERQSNYFYATEQSLPLTRNVNRAASL